MVHGRGIVAVRYLLVEDNAELSEAVMKRLALDGHAVDHAGTLAEAEDCLAAASYDLILLDVMLPDGDGRAFLARSRAHLETPVIVLTARSQVSDRVGALDQGADDYITKPFDFSELEARCRAVLRRRGGSARNEITLGSAIFDPLAGTLRNGAETVELRHREIRLMEVFARHPGQILSKSQLMDRLFSYDTAVTENAIEVYVGRLRRRIDGMGVRIETVRGLGYRIETGAP
jgi:DNA-binding response OmpR family regulator